MIEIGGKPRFGKWVPAWYLSRATVLSMVATRVEVIPVLAAPWKRSERTDWVWRHPDREYPDRCIGGEIHAGWDWGKQLFTTEVEAWAYAVGFYRTHLRDRQRRMAEEVERAAINLGEASAMLALARQRAALDRATEA